MNWSENCRINTERQTVGGIIFPNGKAVVSIAMIRNGGKADVTEIYELVESLAPDKIKNNPNWKAKIRQKLQTNFTRIAKGQYSNN